jgi:hypothetical protein
MPLGLWGPCVVVLAISLGLAALAAAVPPRHGAIVLMAQGLLLLALAQVLRARQASAPAGPAPRTLTGDAVPAEGALTETESTALKGSG